MGMKRLVVLVAAAFVGSIGVSMPAAAQPPPEEQAQGSMMFVLDASGSMTAPLDAGGTRMDAAKAAMNTLIDGLPVNLHVGLEVYGTSTGNSPGEKAAGCQDVQVLAPVGRVDRAAMRAQVAGIVPSGYTPIGRSLEQAAAALPDSGPRAIVLVSDGIDSCAPPDPCEVAKGLAGSGVELAVHAIGFQVDAAARASLECIAEETGGEYHDAPDAESLDELLPEIADRALRFYDVEGEHASGATDLAEAEYLAPGQYKDLIDRDTPYYYQVHVPESATGHFAVVHTIENTPGRTDSSVDFRLVDGEKRECAASRGSREFGYDGPESASLSWTPGPDSTCDPAGPHYLEVTWDNLRDDSNDDIELLVGIEPAVSDEGAPETSVAEFTAPSGEPEIVWGGGSFNDAAALPGSGRYLDRLSYSEYSVYKVWLEWGQSLAYEVEFAESEPVGTATAVTELRGPTRSNDRDHWWRSTDYSGSAVTLDTVATPEVRHANRSGDAEVRHAAQAGWYYVVVKLSPVWTEGDATPSEQPMVEIALDVNGKPVSGPEYATVSIPSTAPPMPTAPSTWQPQAAVTPMAQESEFPWWILGGVVLLAVAVPLLLLLRRRHSGRSPSEH